MAIPPSPTESPFAGSDNLVGQTLDGFWQALVAAYGPAGPFYAIAAMGMFMALLAVPFMVTKRKDPLERFSFRDERLDAELIRLRTDRGEKNNLQSLAPYLEPKDQDELSETRRLLNAAGYKARSAVRVYYFARAVLALSLLTVGLIFTMLLPENPDLIASTGISLAAGLFGYFLPIYWIKRQIAARKQEIENAFPDAMDMMLVCIEGGQSMDQALARVGQEMQLSAGALAEEFQIVSHEFRAGKDRINVLRDLAERCQVNDISSFVTVLIQSSTFGTSVSQALRVYAAEMRDKRLMRAEEKANVLPTKLTLGTMAFTVPPLILILVGPSFIEILRALSGLSTGTPPTP